VRVTALVLIMAPIAMIGVAYVGYPLLLALVSLFRRRRPQLSDPAEWPTISLTVPAYNAQASIRRTLESLLRLSYPADRRQIVVISDASTDDTDAIARSYASRGVELVRLPERRGKTAAENAAGTIVRGDIVVNIDATVRVPPESLKKLVRVFHDSTVGVASGRDVSTSDDGMQSTRGESGYVGFEMWVRSLETRLDSIVGASGCFYGIRRLLYDAHFPEHLSRDFASALIAKENGLRAVSVNDAVCEVPRTPSLRLEVQRKTRTMARGLETLWYKRHLMNPFRYGGFAFMLIGHKLCRWLVYPLLPAAVVGLVLLSFDSRVGAGLLAVAGIVIALGVAGMRWREGRTPAVLAVPGFILAANLAGVLAWIRVLRHEASSIWEPTRRPA
jgi:cellulose synthase/poly-beta-1,6-N-acetylglucosamine synthase-like glycosyltransferase